jgi:hypothetical protein
VHLADSTTFLIIIKYHLKGRCFKIGGTVFHNNNPREKEEDNDDDDDEQ